MSNSATEFCSQALAIRVDEKKNYSINCIINTVILFVGMWCGDQVTPASLK